MDKAKEAERKRRFALAHPSIDKKYGAKYRERHREEIKISHRNWARAHKEQRKAYWLAHRQEMLEYLCQYYKAHKNEHRRRVAEWAKTERGKAYTNLHQAEWIRDDFLQYWRNRYKLLFVENRPCAACGSYNRRQVHHIKSRRDNGSSEMDNLIVLCFRCHMALHYGTEDENVKTLLQNIGLLP